ncbi:MAG: DMT family transporter [Anaerolineae bacterium]
MLETVTMGELAAVAASALWSFTSIQFTLAGRRVGSSAMNYARLALALLYLSLTHWLITGEIWPIHAAPARWLWMSLSGVVGLTLGDAALYQGYMLIGPRRTQLMMTSAPALTTLAARLLWNERLSLPQLLAMTLTVGGIMWVVSEPRQGERHFAGDDDPQAYRKGLVLGGLAALCQAIGLLLSRQGLVGGFSPLSATVIRMAAATVAIVVIGAARGQTRAIWQRLRDRRALWLIVGGALTGPYIGVWLSMEAVQHAAMGIASTLLALAPVLLIPLSAWFFGERVTRRAVLGTLLALMGVALIFLL